MPPPVTEEKILAGMMAGLLTAIGILILFAAVSVMVTIWEAGFFNFLFWNGVFIFILIVSRFIYHRLLESDLF